MFENCQKLGAYPRTENNLGQERKEQVLGTRELRGTIDPNSLWFLRRVSSSLWLLKPVSSVSKTNHSFLMSTGVFPVLSTYSQSVDFYLLILLTVLNFPFSIDKVYIPPSEIEGTSSSDTAHL